MSLSTMGSISELIEKEMKDNDGFLKSADLKTYSAIQKNLPNSNSWK